MKFFLEKLIIGVSIISVCILLVLTVSISYHNRKVATENILLKINSENIIQKSNAILTESLQALDQSLRAYALTKDKAFLVSIANAPIKKQKVFRELRTLLKSQKKQLPLVSIKIDSLCSQLDQVSASMDNYFLYSNYMKRLVEADSLAKFIKLLKDDQGGKVYHTWLKFDKELDFFEMSITQDAQEKFNRATYQNGVIQLILLIVGIPTLIFALYKIDKSFSLSHKLLKLEEDNNLKLEKMVQQRTEEISAQNEEIKSLNEELMAKQDHIENQHYELLQHNEQLLKARELIEQHNNEILQRNEFLEAEVEKRTSDLTHANSELIEYNHQLEQFAFITAHNLRAPVARILGLGIVLDLPGISEKEKQEITPKIMVSCQELDTVIKDLNLILEVKKSNNAVYTEINLFESVAKVKRLLEKEILETKATIKENFLEAPIIYSLAVYIDSILYNLIGNALKYRHPLRNPTVSLKSFYNKGYITIEVADNGLGIDLEKYNDKIFNLYKRFHSHVEGKGLGLYLVKTQVTSLGGKIEVKSELNKGTTFIISFKD